MGVIAGQIIAAGTIMGVLGIGSPNPLDMDIHGGFYLLYSTGRAKSGSKNRPVADDYHFPGNIRRAGFCFMEGGRLQRTKNGLPPGIFLFRSVRNSVQSS